MAKFSCLKKWGYLPKWTDSVSGIVGNDGYIHLIGGAITAIHSSNKHYVCDMDLNIVYDIDAPWHPISETGLSKILGGNTIVRIGGAGGAATDCWKFDPSIAGYTADSWVQIGGDDIGIGDRRMAAFVSTDTECFIFGGWNNDTYCKTSDFETFTSLGDLPNEIKRISACAYGMFDGLIWLIGGSTNMDTGESLEFLDADFLGMVWTYDPNTDTFAQIGSGDTDKFGYIWLDFVTTATKMYITRGYNSGETRNDPNPALQGNHRGVLVGNDGASWAELDPLFDGDTRSTFYESHRQTVIQIDANRFYALLGFEKNSVWLYDELG